MVRSMDRPLLLGLRTVCLVLTLVALGGVCSHSASAQDLEFDRLSQAASRAFEHKNPAEAKKLFQEALEIALAMPAGDPRVTSTFRLLAAVQTVLGEFREAEASLMNALLIVERHHGSLAPERAEILLHLGTVFRAEGRLDRAEWAIGLGVKLGRQAHGPKSVWLADALGRLFAVRFDSGQRKESEAPLRESIRIRRAAGPKQKEALANDLDSLGRLLSALGRSAEALEQVEASLAMRPEGCPCAVLVDSMCRKAQLLRKLGRANEALEVEARVAELRRSGDDSARFRRDGLGRDMPGCDPAGEGAAT